MDTFYPKRYICNFINHDIKYSINPVININIYAHICMYIIYLFFNAIILHTDSSAILIITTHILSYIYMIHFNSAMNLIFFKHKNNVKYAVKYKFNYFIIYNILLFFKQI